MLHAAHLILYVSDQTRARAFYAAALASTPVLDVPGMTEFRLREGVVLGLMPESGIRRLLGASLPPPPTPASVSAALRAELYLVVDDPAACHARAVAAGARELDPLSVRDWGHEVAYSLDPDGHVLAFARAASA
jgi:catechol 2,3-dioxygenase-like lactoylglutathione lyase family enzyme